MILSMEKLQISFLKNGQSRVVVRDLSMQVAAGEMLGIVGESGSGKSLTNLALMGLLPKSTKVTARKLAFKNRELLAFSQKDWRLFRGSDIAMIFQNAKSAMNPMMKIKTQLFEAIKRNNPNISQQDMLNEALQLLEQVGLPAAGLRLEQYPHELSGGMAQRVMIAMALACKPALLIADEPTTGLDSINKKQILQLLDKIRRENNMAIILVSHDIHLVQEYTQRMNIMYSGELMESGLTQRIMQAPHHPYTRGLLNCLPRKNVLQHKQYLPTIEGLVLPIDQEVDGCRFYNRCPYAYERCLHKVVMKPSVIDAAVLVNCHKQEEL